MACGASPNGQRLSWISDPQFGRSLLCMSKLNLGRTSGPPKALGRWSNMSTPLRTNILERLSFQATVGQQISIDLRSTPFSEAHVPMQMVQVAYGDGEAIICRRFNAKSLATCVEDAWSL